MKRERKFSITAKFILWFLFIALVPLLIATFLAYDRSRKVLQEEVVNRLQVIASNKAAQIDAYFEETKRNVVRLSFMPEMTEAITQYMNAFNKGGVFSLEYKEADNEFRPFLSYHQKSFGYKNILLISAQGDIVYSNEKRKGFSSVYELALYEHSSLAKSFIETMKSRSVQMSDFEYDPQKQEASFFVVAPIMLGGEILGTVVAQLEMHELYQVVQDYTGFGETGETVLVKRVGDRAIFLTPLRFDQKAAFIREIKLGSKESEEIQSVVAGENGSGFAIDYRQKEVWAVWRFLPVSQLGMIVKMDSDEIFSSAQGLRNTLIQLSIVLLVMVVVMALSIAGSISRPIRELTKVSRIITSGDLDERVRVKTNDEIGELSTAFNQMTDALVKAKAKVEEEREKLEEQKKLLEKANKELDSFVYTVSHDLRAPLRAISSFSSFLEEDYSDKLDDEGKDNISEIRKGVDRMNELIDDLLLLSRVSRIRNPYQDVDMNVLIHSIVERIAFDVKEKNVDLVIQENLPVVYCDRIKMGELFLNLINNAIKFSSKENKNRPRVEVACMEKDEEYEFFVKDNGIGIDPKYHEQIFGIFKRLHSSKEYEGTGAGLGIVKRVVDDHKGKIWIVSQVGEGAAFYFTIPKMNKKEGEETNEEASENYSRESPEVISNIEVSQ